MPTILKHFDALVELGLKVIPLRENTKTPICKGWTHWDFKTCRSVLQRFPNSNIGLLLGDIIDVEGDSEEANRRIAELIGDYPHPAYTSSKSTHHLFLNPEPRLTIYKFEDIEFRAHRHQSVLPPSRLPNDVSYKWLRSTVFPIPKMPERLLGFYRKIRGWNDDLKPGHIRVRCFDCRQFKFMHKKRFNLELLVLKNMGLPWSCHGCRNLDLRPLCRTARKSVC